MNCTLIKNFIYFFFKKVYNKSSSHIILSAIALSCGVGVWFLLMIVIPPGVGGGCAPAKALTAARSAAPLPLPKGLRGGGGIGSSTAALAAARSGIPLPNGRTLCTFRSSEMKLLTAMYFCVTGYSKYCNVLGQSISVWRPDLYKKKYPLIFYHGTP